MLPAPRHRPQRSRSRSRHPPCIRYLPVLAFGGVLHVLAGKLISRLFIGAAQPSVPPPSPLDAQEGGSCKPQPLPPSVTLTPSSVAAIRVRCWWHARDAPTPLRRRTKPRGVVVACTFCPHPPPPPPPPPILLCPPRAPACSPSLLPRSHRDIVRHVCRASHAAFLPPPPSLLKPFAVICTAAAWCGRSPSSPLITRSSAGRSASLSSAAPPASPCSGSQTSSCSLHAASPQATPPPPCPPPISRAYFLSPPSGFRDVYFAEMFGSWGGVLDRLVGYGVYSWAVQYATPAPLVTRAPHPIHTCSCTTSPSSGSCPTPATAIGPTPTARCHPRRAAPPRPHPALPPPLSVVLQAKHDDAATLQHLPLDRYGFVPFVAYVFYTPL
jgi:hypothetical protein